MTEHTLPRPEKGTDAELYYLRGYEAATIKLRAELAAEREKVAKLQELLEMMATCQECIKIGLGLSTNSTEG